ncbi:MAG: PadR family transcriptional regulator [Gemmatimonadota bacterium]|jgi:transcriptional regulator
MDLLQGTLDGLILKALSWRPLHGYAIARWLRSASEDVFQIEEGALYPALHRMEQKGWVESEWGLSENNRRAKFYQLTDKGRQALEKEREAWTRYAAAVARVFKSPREAAT